MIYMYTLIPQRAQIKLLFALRQAVFEIVYFYIRDLDVTLKVKCDFGSIDALYVYTYTPKGPN